MQFRNGKVLILNNILDVSAGFKQNVTTTVSTVTLEIYQRDPAIVHRRNSRHLSYYFQLVVSRNSPVTFHLEF